MGIASNFRRQQKLDQKQLDDRELSCTFCNIQTKVQWYVFEGGNWLPFKSAFEGRQKRLLCQSCARTSPSLRPKWSEMNSLQREEMRRGGFIEIDGKLEVNPSASHENFAFLPNFFPAYWLGQHQVECEIVDVTSLRNCHIMKLVPTFGQDEEIDIQFNMYGCIWTSMPPWYYFNSNECPFKVKFDREEDIRNFSRTIIRRKR